MEVASSSCIPPWRDAARDNHNSGWAHMRGPSVSAQEGLQGQGCMDTVLGSIWPALSANERIESEKARAQGAPCPARFHRAESGQRVHQGVHQGAHQGVHEGYIKILASIYSKKGITQKILISKFKLQDI